MEKDDELLRKLMQETETKQEPPLSFTPNVMRTWEAQKVKKGNPLIGSKIWLFMALCFGILVILTFILSPQNTELPTWIKEADKMDELINQIAMPFLALIMGVVLMLADDIWRRVKKITPFS